MSSDSEPHAMRSAAAPPFASRGALARRLVTVPRTLAAFVIVSALWPLLAALSLVVDAGRAALFRKPWVAIRLVAFLWLYLLSEVLGLAALLFVWIASGFGSDRQGLIDRTYGVQSWWTHFLFDGVRRLFGLRFRVEGDELVTPGPILVFIRHASIVDTLLPSVFITRRHGVRLRFVLKRELLQDPCLDIAGSRIPNHFVARGAKVPASTEERIAWLEEQWAAVDAFAGETEGAC